MPLDSASRLMLDLKVTVLTVMSKFPQLPSTNKIPKNISKLETNTTTKLLTPKTKTKTTAFATSPHCIDYRAIYNKKRGKVQSNHQPRIQHEFSCLLAQESKISSD